MAPTEPKEELIDLLARALPFIEDAEKDPCYKPGIVRALAKRIRATVESADAKTPISPAEVR